MDKEEKIDYEKRVDLPNRMFSQGDQREESRSKFMLTFYRKCILCDNEEVELKTYMSGFRFTTGSTYGVDVYKCQKCGWTTSFLWDEESKNYLYYEIENFKEEKKYDYHSRKKDSNS